MTTTGPIAHNPFEYIAELREREWWVRELSGQEGLSKPWSFTMSFFSREGDIFNPDDFVGARAYVRVMRAGRNLRRIAGVVVEASLNATGTGAPEPYVRVEPRLSLLQHRSDNRVFRDMTAVEIVQKVLEYSQIGAHLRLRQTYKRRPYCVQFRETDLDFVHRLLEEEGIFYFFPDHLDQKQLDPQAENMIILGDNPGAYEPMVGGEELPYRPVDGLRRDLDHVLALRQRVAMGPGKITLRDWNLEKPSLDMDVVASGPTPGGVEWYDFPGKYEVPEEGQHKVDVIGESFACSSATISGRADTARMAMGHTVLVTDSPAGFDPGKWVLTSLTHHFRRAAHEGEQTHLEVDFDALPATVTFRPPIVTPRPVITNPLTGYVVGPPGEDIHTDELARVKVHFPWDRQMARDDNASHWVPVLQDNTGSSSAMPRIGWEVLVGFVEGDPDRPMVLGRVYNAKDPFPETLPAGKTKTALRSLSSPSRTGHNEIWIEDAAGRELVSIQAEKDKNVVIANDKKEDVLNTEENTILENETIGIGANNTESITDAHMLTVEGNQRITVSGSRTRKVGAGDLATINGDRSTSIGATHFRKIGGFDNVAVPGSIRETVGGLDLEASLQANRTTAAALKTLTVGGAVVEVTAQGKKEDTDQFRMETIGMALITKAATTFDLRVGTDRKTTVGALFSVNAVTAAIHAVVSITKKAAALVEYKGSEGVTLKSGGSEVNFTAEGITMKSDKDIVINASGANTLEAPKATLNE